ncbi:BQ5605_C050g12474 [Microbotryum silenes-dioicae]|uniref:BQ5605_C050g12474 protein n=1 Tax=Microbotryum silenes-dioicae TaxID=796604 RepID=A0A2X0NAG1_9BASI|nr:BQ5605_C050g12474 [Microbotryum silenes-dioicae]
MAKSHDVDSGSLIWNLIKLFLTLALFGGLAYTVKLVVAAWNSAVRILKLELRGNCGRTLWRVRIPRGGLLIRIWVLDFPFSSTKDSLAHQGVSISSKGVAVKTEKRQVTAEETADKMRNGIMKGWEASTFKVPSSLAHSSNLAGSTHDKQKTEYEAKYGPKKHKNHVD